MGVERHPAEGGTKFPTGMAFDSPLPEIGSELRLPITDCGDALPRARRRGVAGRL
jgi:hypothetical protein